MKWTEDITYKFVKEYLEHECLYNSRSPNYKIKPTRDAALVKICEVMNIPDFGVKEAQAKIKSIRSTNSQETKKINDSSKSGAGKNDLYVPSLKWYKLYHDRIKEKELTQSITQDNLVISEFEDTATITPTEYDSSSSNVSIQPSSVPVHSRKRNIRCLENIMDKVKSVTDRINQPTGSTSNETEFDIYAKSIAAQLNSMPTVLALQAQCHINNYLTNLRNKHLTNSLNINGHTPLSTTTYISSPSPTERITDSPIHATPATYMSSPSPQAMPDFHTQQVTTKYTETPTMQPTDSSNVVYVLEDEPSTSKYSDILMKAVSSIK